MNDPADWNMLKLTYALSVFGGQFESIALDVCQIETSYKISLYGCTAYTGLEAIYR